MDKDLSFTFFKRLIEKQFDNNEFIPNDLHSWTSLQMLININAIDEYYDVLFSGAEIKATASLEDLHQKIINKVNN